jgi:hypothetical protein
LSRRTSHRSTNARTQGEVGATTADRSRELPR